MSEYVPDVWVVVELTGTRVTEPDNKYHRILAGWYGGYTTGDSWKMNSGITKIVDKGDHWEVHGYSGSVYFCHKNAERFSGYTSSIYESFAKQSTEELGFNHVDMKDVLERYLEV
jgi:hypothetical protein